MADPRAPLTWEAICGYEETLFSYAGDGPRCLSHGEAGARIYTLTAGEALTCSVCGKRIKTAVDVEKEREG